MKPDKPTTKQGLISHKHSHSLTLLPLSISLSHSRCCLTLDLEPSISLTHVAASLNLTHSLTLAAALLSISLTHAAASLNLTHSVTLIAASLSISLTHATASLNLTHSQWWIPVDPSVNWSPSPVPAATSPGSCLFHLPHLLLFFGFKPGQNDAVLPWCKTKKVCQSLVNPRSDLVLAPKNALLEFVRVMKAKEQVVTGILHPLTIQAIEVRKKKLYEAKIWVKPWLNHKELQEFKHAKDATQFTTSDIEMSMIQGGNRSQSMIRQFKMQHIML